ncbi:asparagine synthase [Lysobacter concretionis Ko07 = DSM 16239]|uniref:asparagine synthase (glutamine-hydrolyzing) n=1 Tax=Lysobacter concretionis Ko07 = DSM 16239 TaxID=1122185 RepID=A0A0A0ERH7_9GAMM|nr:MULTISPECIES: asparagine synthase (glutamine-hydrolyzing) [Lysobacter]KGM52805.1 asparagine synthase [Lysobacter concretionis Ko07 = DSM 16239]QOD91246.1 asparagine synthase (glutamine-hydrolyzing) [Lysobacter sp. CW239]
MCGIAGAWSPTPRDSADELRALGARMGSAIAHRGPDDAGSWVEPGVGLVLAHRRLAIVDLSPEGHQPMASPDGRWVIAFNGEIYNHAALRSELAALGHGFRGHSDTEVLLAAITQWGVEAALERGNGMLALAAWDRRDRVLWLARDRVGKKPLYYGWSGDGTFVFGSELAALRAHPALRTEVDPDALALLLRLDYIPAPHAILRGVHKLPAGRLLRVDQALVRAGDAAFDPASAPQTWWSSLDRQRAAIRQGFDGDEGSALSTLDTLLRDATALRMQADVPLGAFLSGGTDSSLVTALMQAQSARPVRSFSIGFDNAVHDESGYAAAVARHLGTDHTRLHVDGHAALDLVPELPRIFDEPFADSSQVPTALLCRLARQHVTVALSGDGGDELFFGYGRYARALRNEQRLARLPRQLLARLAGDPGERARLGGLAALRAELAAGDLQGLARQRVSRWRRPEDVVIGARRVSTAYDDPAAMPGVGTGADALMQMDFACYLAEDILTKVDRASMAVGLEARAPLLDWRVAEFAWSLPLSMKWHEGTLKHLPKQLLSRYLPDELVHRPKSGFGAPVGDWLRGPLRDWAEAQLDERRLREEGHFRPEPIRAIWAEFLAGQRKWHTHLWGVLMFQAWRETLNQV